jgi:hypothetical protein
MFFLHQTTRQKQKDEEEALWSSLATPSKHVASDPPNSTPAQSRAKTQSSIPAPTTKAAAEVTSQPSSAPAPPTAAGQAPSKGTSFTETATREELITHIQKQTVLLKKSKGKSDGVSASAPTRLTNGNAELAAEVKSLQEAMALIRASEDALVCNNALWHGDMMVGQKTAAAAAQDELKASEQRLNQEAEKLRTVRACPSHFSR